MEKKQSFGLKEIFNLAEDDKITLPTVQRGFVWRPYQIENFWDSLLRGYPVGAFVLAKNADKLELLDGQQRATSTYLAFCGQSALCRNSTFKTTANSIQIFIDLGKPDVGDNRKYIFRVITKSHPWGYRRISNQRTLESIKINTACKKYTLVNGNYLETPLKNFWPYDAICPVPFSVFLHNNTLEQVEIMIREWQKDAGYVGQAVSGCNLYSIEKIWHEVQNMLSGLQIPAIYLDIDRVIENYEETCLPSESEACDDSIGDDEKRPPDDDHDTDEIENLFIRLNSGGTPLRGEELNYSILKANIGVDLQRKLEEACSGMFSPSRFVTLAFRLFQHSNERTDQSNALSMRIKAKQFQSAMRDSDKENKFFIFLQDIIDKDKVFQLRNLLAYSPTNTFGLPQFMYSSLAEKAPEVMFILLYRLWISKDVFVPGKDLYRRMLGIITMFYWFGRGGTRRDHSRLLNNVSAKLSEKDSNKFWSKPLITAVSKVDARTNTSALIRPMTIKELENLIPKGSKYIYANVDDFASYVEEYAPFLYNMLYNRDMLLYAQRESLHVWFSRINYSFLEDTNLPYDWDHIFPQKWVHSQKKIKVELRQWYNTIGNLRAWPYSLNRSDQDSSLSEKLNVNETVFREDICKFVGLDSDQCDFQDDILCKWSACDSAWKDIKFATMKDEGIARNTIRIIRSRAISIYKQWYKSLKISDLVN